MMSDDTDGTAESGSTKSDLHRRVMAVGQDLLYNVSRGRVKTPKHVSLAMAVKNLTGSSQEAIYSLHTKSAHMNSTSVFFAVMANFRQRSTELYRMLSTVNTAG